MASEDMCFTASSSLLQGRTEQLASGQKQFWPWAHQWTKWPILFLGICRKEQPTQAVSSALARLCKNRHRASHTKHFAALSTGFTTTHHLCQALWLLSTAGLVLVKLSPQPLPSTKMHVILIGVSMGCLQTVSFEEPAGKGEMQGCCVDFLEQRKAFV